MIKTILMMVQCITTTNLHFYSTLNLHRVQFKETQQSLLLVQILTTLATSHANLVDKKFLLYINQAQKSNADHLQFLSQDLLI
jgi:hypothetical protein